MFVLANLISAAAQVLQMVFSIMLFLVAIRCVLSWFNPDPYNPLVSTIIRTTDPMLRPIQKIFRPHIGGMDFTPVVLGIIIVFLQNFLVKSLSDLAIYLVRP